MSDGPSAAGIVGHLANPDHRQVVAAVILGATTLEAVKVATGLQTRAVVTAVGRLTDSELIQRSGDGQLRLATEAIRRAAIESHHEGREEAPDLPEDTAQVLRSFVREGRLVSIPTQRTKRLTVLDLLAQEFEPGRHYDERTVNELLRRWHDDTATLRRYLVDEGFLDREDGQYWRAGGTVLTSRLRGSSPAP
jgi:hypothetical protein